MISSDLSTTIGFSIPSLSLACLLLFGGSGSAWAQQNEQCNDDANYCARIVSEPIVKGKNVKLRVKITDSNGNPVDGVDSTRFQVVYKDTGEVIKNVGFSKPEEITPPPARIIMLLDYSGSMNFSTSSTTKKPKFKGAIEGIKQLVEELKDSQKDSSDIKVSLVPFAVIGDSGCPNNKVNNQLLSGDNSKYLGQFLAVNNSILTQRINFLSANPPCDDTATNLYDAVTVAVKFLGDKQNPDLYPPAETKKPAPRLSIIVLTDGFDTEKNQYQKKTDSFKCGYFDTTLKDDLQNLAKPLNIPIHTLGYGRRPDKFNNQNDQYGINDFTCKNAQKILKGTRFLYVDFVAYGELNKIAKITGGISAIAGNTNEVLEAFAKFRKAILGEYEIVFTEKHPERDSKHIIKVVVRIDKSKIESNFAEYQFSGIGAEPPGLLERSGILLGIIAAAGVFGFLPFHFWAESLKPK